MHKVSQRNRKTWQMKLGLISHAGVLRGACGEGRNTSSPKNAWLGGQLELEGLVFEKREIPEYPDKNLLEQGRKPTWKSTHLRRRRRDSNPDQIGGRRVLSSHHRATLLYTSAMSREPIKSNHSDDVKKQLDLWENNSSARASLFLVHFFDVHCTTATSFPFPFWTWVKFFKNSTPGWIVYTWQIERVQIDAIKFERTQI